MVGINCVDDNVLSAIENSRLNVQEKGSVMSKSQIKEAYRYDVIYSTSVSLFLLK